MSAVSIRALDPEEWAAFKALRLHALQSAPGVFGSSYDAEVNLTPEEWQQTVRGPGNQAFGLFATDRLMGITAVFTARADPSGQSAILAMSYVMPEHRGRGLSKIIYETRLEWVRMHPQFKRVIVSHRESNERSRRAIERHGFSPTHRAPRVWPDGTEEDELFYELRISVVS